MAEWAENLILTELEHARDRGEGSVTTTELRNGSGVGADDWEEAISALVDAGKVEEFAPGEWALPSPSEGTPPDGLDSELEEVVEGPESIGLRRMPEIRAQAGAIELEAMGTAVLSRAMVEALTDEALGQIVKAGVAEANGEGRDGRFMLTVT